MGLSFMFQESKVLIKNEEQMNKIFELGQNIGRFGIG